MKNKLFMIFSVGTIVLFAVLMLKPQFSIAQNNKKENKWDKLSAGVFIDLNSIKKGEENSKTAWFKLTPTFKEKLYTTDEIQADEEEIQITAWCDSESLYIEHIKYYDKNGNILEDNPNTHGAGCDYQGLVNGNIYYRALCK